MYPFRKPLSKKGAPLETFFRFPEPLGFIYIPRTSNKRGIISSVLLLRLKLSATFSDVVNFIKNLMKIYLVYCLIFIKLPLNLEYLKNYLKR